MDNCGTRCIQFIMFMLNFIFFVCGIGLVTGAVFIMWAPDVGSFFNIAELTAILQNPYLQTACYIMGVAGIIVIFFSIIGCCGAFLESKLLLAIYFFIVLILFCAQLAGAILAALYSSEINGFISTEAGQYLREKYMFNTTDNPDSFSDAVNSFQMRYECCGIADKSDYDSDQASNRPTDFEGYPVSCCKDMDPPCLEVNAYPNGCGEELKTILDSNTTILGAALVGVACLELFLMVFSVLLCRSAGSKEDY